MTGELISLFKAGGCEVTGIQIRVQVRNLPHAIKSTPRKMSKASQSAVEELAVKLPDSPLKATLQRLAKRKL